MPRGLTTSYTSINPTAFGFIRGTFLGGRVSATATTGPGTVTITAALSEPARTRNAPGCSAALPRPTDRTQGYHEPPYRGLPLHCCGIDHAFLDR
ncbi:hypothetical protein J6590_041496 [Homalodisca vitripennis]|nr:hypothetical protein J6590_041496 [Homalodisca vitripennis]